MRSASVSFLRTAGAVEMELYIDGSFIMRSASQESIVRELQLQGARGLSIEDKFFTELPTSLKSLSSAAAVPFEEIMAALKLIAACASVEELALLPLSAEQALSQTDALDIV